MIIGLLAAKATKEAWLVIRSDFYKKYTVQQSGLSEISSSKILIRGTLSSTVEFVGHEKQYKAIFVVSCGQHTQADFSKSEHNRKLNNISKYSDTRMSLCVSETMRK